MSCRFTSLLSCPLLSSIYAHLCEFQADNYSVTFEDIIRTVRITAVPLVDLSEEELKHFSGIIFEAILKPVFSSKKGGAGLRIKKDILGSEKIFFQEMVKALEEKKKWPVFSEESTYVEVCWTNFLTEVDKLYHVSMN
jgi:hypothetical protein